MPGEDAVKPANLGVKLTYDDFVLFPDDGKRHELIDGEHYVTPSPNATHQRILLRMSVQMGGYLVAHRYGELFLSPFDVVFSDFDVVEPDLLYLSASRADDVFTEKHLRGAPDLVVEIGSPSTRKRDATIKHDLYERHGVSEYWVVDPDAEAITVYRRDEKRYVLSAQLTLAHSDVLATPLIPGLEMPLVFIFRG